MLIKPHRQVRSKRVSSETGVATVTTAYALAGRFEMCLNEIEQLIKPFAPNERKSIIAALAKRVVKESERNE